MEGYREGQTPETRRGVLKRSLVSLVCLASGGWMLHTIEPDYYGLAYAAFAVAAWAAVAAWRFNRAQRGNT